MTDAVGIIVGGRAVPRGASPRVGLAQAYRRAFAVEIEQRRLFLWLPVALGAGIALYFAADREPSLAVTTALAVLAAGAAAWLRAHRRAFVLLVGIAAVFAGMATAGWRSARLAGPVLDRIRVVDLQGTIERVDHRREGARFVLRPSASEALAALPARIRLTSRRAPGLEAGSFVELKARLLPPSHAAAPGAYDFARDAWFERIGAVGSVLGRMDEAVPPEPPGLLLSMTTAIDRARNALARRVDAIVGGDAGAIAAAMVTGKRDLLSDDAKELIRQAGIFHVITISGVQMTLVAGIFFVGLRRLLALSPALALRYPIKKWAAGAAILAACGYDLMTGSRVGTERALIMTIILLGAVLLDRQALTMRNLALAALVVLALEPEALLGASFQLSFAAVGALVAVYEARAAAPARDERAGLRGGTPRAGWLRRRLTGGHGLRGTLVATAAATGATASFMAAAFHEMNPYVLVGNPLTLAVIEVFAVPGALLGTLLYPLGLDAPVWHYVGLGIAFIMRAARVIGAMPGSSLHLPAFAPWALPFLALAVLSVVIWRTRLMRATAVPFALVGLAGALCGPTVDIAVAAGGDAAAVRGSDGRLAVIGRRPSTFDAEQWLRGDADGRDARDAIRKDNCDALGCVGHLADGRAVAVVLEPAGFAEDCLRASVVVTPLIAPRGCAAEVVIDRDRLRASGAVALRATDDGFRLTPARAPDQDRPWSPAPARPWAGRLRAPDRPGADQ